MVGRRRGCSGVAVRLILLRLLVVSLSWTLGSWIDGPWNQPLSGFALSILSYLILFT